MDAERYFVWGLNGFLKVLVFERKYVPGDGDRESAYVDCLRIEDPKARVGA